MTYNELIEIDEDAEMIDLGVASLETEGSGNGLSESTSNGHTYSFE